MAPNRSRSNSNAQNTVNRTNSPLVRRQPSRQANQISHSPQASLHIQSQATRTQINPNGFNTIPRKSTTPLVPPERAMSPTSRYNQNLKVLRRHDPSIMSIFDQFSHVCLYHHNGAKWEKKGYEGSMFLFERKQEPQYGFFILNRMGMDDYIQCLSPDDEMITSDGYLMYMTRAPYSPNRSSPDMGRQGKSDVIEVLGLWMLTTDARESVSVVLMRLFDYVKRGERYPDEFRYGPGRRPPPNPNSVGQRSDVEDDMSDYNSRTLYKPSSNAQHPFFTAAQQSSLSQSQSQSMGMSAVDQLFAKFVPIASSTPSTSLEVTSSLASSASNVSVSSQSQATQSPATNTNNSGTPSGIALLNSIFASVTPSSSSSSITISTSNSTSHHPASASSSKPNNLSKYISSSTFPPPPSVPPSADAHSQFFPQSQQPPYSPSHNTGQSYAQSSFQAQAQAQTPTPPPLEIHSPKPSVAGLPHILSTDVISTLLGLKTSPSPSTASSSQSISTSARNEKQDGGYVADRGEDSEDSMLRDIDGGGGGLDSPEVRPRRGVVSRNGGAGVAQGQSQAFLSSAIASGLGSGPGSAQGFASGPAQIFNMGSSLKGDVTPRARAAKGLEAEGLHGNNSSQTVLATHRSNHSGNHTPLIWPESTTSNESQSSRPPQRRNTASGLLNTSASGKTSPQSAFTNQQLGRGRTQSIAAATSSTGTADFTATATTTTTGVAFQAVSELWPHQHLNSHRHTSNAHGPSSYPYADADLGDVAEATREDELQSPEELGEEGIVELDFSEISVLSDPSALDARRLSGKGKLQKSHSSMTVTGNANSVDKRVSRVVSETNAYPKKSITSANSTARGSNSSNKEGISNKANGIHLNVSITATPTAPAAVLPSITTLTQMEVNGQAKAKANPLNQGSSSINSSSHIPDPNWVKDLIIGEFKKTSSQLKLDKYDFVSEILTLIHTDKDFVERMYQAYLQT